MAISPSSTSGEVAEAYAVFVQDRGGDTAENRQAAVEYLHALGIADNVINQVWVDFINSQRAGSTSAASVVDAQPNPVQQTVPSGVATVFSDFSSGLTPGDIGYTPNPIYISGDPTEPSNWVFPGLDTISNEIRSPEFDDPAIQSNYSQLPVVVPDSVTPTSAYLTVPEAAQTPGSLGQAAVLALEVQGGPSDLSISQVFEDFGTGPRGPQTILGYLSVNNLTLSDLSRATGQSITSLQQYFSAAGISVDANLATSTTTSTTGTSTAAAVTLTAGALAALWTQYQSNPQVLLQRLSQGGASLTDLASATGVSLSSITSVFSSAGLSIPTNILTSASSVSNAVAGVTNLVPTDLVTLDLPANLDAAADFAVETTTGGLNQLQSLANQAKNISLQVQQGFDVQAAQAAVARASQGIASALGPLPVLDDPAVDFIVQQADDPSLFAGALEAAGLGASSLEAATNALKLQAQAQATFQARYGQPSGQDWRVRLQLSPGATYLYKDPQPGILAPLFDTDGIIFPYTPQIETSYNANYDKYDLVHSNYRGYFYKGSTVNDINIRATFTAQDTQEANYLLAVIHFFRSVTKMFYGQDELRGAPPPLTYLTGLGEFQFNNHPCLVSAFTYSLPSDVDYIRALAPNNYGTNLLSRRARTGAISTNPIASAVDRILNTFGVSNPTVPQTPVPSSLNQYVNNTNGATYVPTKMEINITLLPTNTRSQVSQQFSLKEFANGSLIKGGFW